MLLQYQGSHYRKTRIQTGGRNREDVTLAWLQNGDADEGKSRKVDILDLDDLKALDF
jgi:hypothetical protein